MAGESHAVRADDTAGTLLNIATLSASESSVTKQWQRVHLADPTTPTQHAKVGSGGELTVSAVGGIVSALPAGTYTVTGPFALSSQMTALALSAQIAALALSAQFPGQLAGASLDSAAYELSATSAVITASAGFRVFVYGIKATAEASAGWHRWVASGAAVSAFEGYQRADAFGGYVDNVSPPAYLYVTSAGASIALQTSAAVSAFAGALRFWRAA